MAKPTGRPPGRPAKPVEQKIAEGNKGKRKLPQASYLKGLEEIPSPPSSLTTVGKSIWTLVWESGRKWLKSDRDFSVVFEFAQAWEEYQSIRLIIRRAGFLRVVDAPNGISYLNPLYKREETLHARLNTLRSVLALSPADYARLQLAEVSDEEENLLLSVMEQGR